LDCWHCRRTAVGVCRFCGRGICEDHAKMQPFILELFKTTDVTRSLVVATSTKHPVTREARLLMRMIRKQIDRLVDEGCWAPAGL